MVSQRQFKRKISVWRFDKNIKSHEMEAIVRKKIQRMVAERKQSTFRLRGVPVEEAKINRYLRGKESSFLTIRIPSPGIGQYLSSKCGLILTRNTSDSIRSQLLYADRVLNPSTKSRMVEHTVNP